jgi:hypothetical protein
VTVSRDNYETVLERIEEADIFAPWIGVTGGPDLKLGKSAPISVAKLREAYETWFPAYMAGKS